MNKPDLIGMEVLTPDGRGSILVLYPKGVEVNLNTISSGQVLIGRDKGNGGLHRFYSYEEVEIIKGRYNFIEKPFSTIPLDEK